MISSLRILCELQFPSQTQRLWDGSAPYVDLDGNLWRCCALSEGSIDQIEAAINGEAVTIQLAVSGIDQELSNLAWSSNEEEDVIGSVVRILTQQCDEYDNPIEGRAPEVEFTGSIDNILFNDVAQEDGIASAVAIEVTNRFTLRTKTSGSVLSDVDQRARSARINPAAPIDRFCERVPSLAEKTVNWPSFD